MRRKTLYAIIDTETANTLALNGRLFMRDVQTYDIALAIIDRLGKEYAHLRLIIDEVFHNPSLMTSAYYAKKIPEYIEQINNGEAQLVSIYEARKMVRDLLTEYNVKVIMAHNARFDENALKSTIRYQTKSKARYFMPYDIEWWDTMKMAQDVICSKKSYIKFCEDNGFMTKHKTPRPRKTAEVLYRYITQDPTFTEKHRGYDDIQIEKEIFAYCIKQHKKMRRKLWENDD